MAAGPGDDVRGRERLKDTAHDVMLQDMKTRLRQRFNRTVATAGLDVEDFERLDIQYSGRGRHYHDWNHIAECLEQFDDIVPLLRDPLAVELALWFHDAVYEPGGTHNEADSALMALRMIEPADGQLARKVQHFIEATSYTGSSVPVDPDLDYLLDIDLAPFGKPFDAFWEDVLRLDREDSDENQSIRRTRRLEFYRRILDGRFELFRTPFFRERYLERALDNVRRAVVLLELPDDRS